MIRIYSEAEEQCNEREMRFCQEYVMKPNGAEAARKAGYAEDNAANQAYDMLKREHIQKYIKQLESHVLEMVGVSRGRVLREYVAKAFEEEAIKKGVELDESIQMKALEALRKMGGFDEPEKIQNYNVDGDETKIDWV